MRAFQKQLITDVDAYISYLAQPHQEIVSRVRTLISQYPELTESLKWNVPVYSMNKTNHLLGIQVFKSHVNLNFFGGVELNDPRKILLGSGKRVRHVTFRTIEDIDSATLQAFIEEAIVNEAALARTRRK